MKNLSLDGDNVPILYRIKVTDSSGELNADSTSYFLSGEVGRATTAVAVAYQSAGYPSVTVDIYPA